MGERFLAVDGRLCPAPIISLAEALREHKPKKYANYGVRGERNGAYEEKQTTFGFCIWYHHMLVWSLKFNCISVQSLALFWPSSHGRAMHSISTSTPLGSCFTATQLRAGL